MRKSVVTNNDNTRLKLSFELTAKMLGILALSTNACMNELCNCRANSNCGCICEHCYARNSIENYSSFRENITSNFKVLSEPLEWKDIPQIDYTEVPYFRFESHGDLFCKDQALNYLAIARENPYVQMALWTKNPWFMDEALKESVKPHNLNCIYSYLFVVNSDEDLAKAMKRWARVKEVYPWMDKIFIVLGKEYAAEHSHMVNCGARSCYNCHRCYDGFEEVIYEVLK